MHNESNLYIYTLAFGELWADGWVALLWSLLFSCIAS